MDLQREMKMKNKITNYINKMPSLPATVTRVMEVCNDPKASPADLNKIISMDPVLMGKVMQLINSAYYSRPNKINSLVRAIILLGLNTVKNLALSTAILANMSSKGPQGPIDMDGFWEHSLCTGVISKLIAKKIKADPKTLEEYFIAGLLHDIGKIPITRCFPDEYLAAISKSDMEKTSLHMIEMSLFGFDHQETGEMISSAWKIEGGIADATRYHHNSSEYDGEHKKVVYAVSIADFASLYFERGFAGNRHPVEPAPEIYNQLGIQFDEIEPLQDEIKAEIDKARVFLKLSQ